MHTLSHPPKYMCIFFAKITLDQYLEGKETFHKDSKAKQHL